MTTTTDQIKGDGVYEVRTSTGGIVIVNPYGTEYTTTNTHCTCKGFEYRKTCKHVVWVQENIRPSESGEN